MCKLGGLENSSMNKNQLNKLKKFVASEMAASIFGCEDVEWDESDNTLRVFITKNDRTSININDCVLVSRLLNSSDKLDNMIESAYTLEVSSLGLNDSLLSNGNYKNLEQKEV